MEMPVPISTNSYIQGIDFMLLWCRQIKMLENGQREIPKPTTDPNERPFFSHMSSEYFFDQALQLTIVHGSSGPPFFHQQHPLNF